MPDSGCSSSPEPELDGLDWNGEVDALADSNDEGSSAGDELGIAKDTPRKGSKSLAKSSSSKGRSTPKKKISGLRLRHSRLGRRPQKT